MLLQTELNEAVYLAQTILSVIGVFFLLGIVLWLIRKRQVKAEAQVAEVLELPQSTTAERSANYAALNPMTESQAQARTADLDQVYQQWKRESLLTSEDNKSAFVRCGVEKNGLRYQITTTSQAQALAMLLFTLLADQDPGSSSLFEALFANLLAHPAYGQADLSSWKNMPDLPRSPKLDPDLHAEAWILFALRAGLKQWPQLSRFRYAEVINDRSLALMEVWKTIDPAAQQLIPNSRYLISILEAAQPELGWETLEDKSLPEFGTKALVLDVNSKSQEELIALGLGWLQMGLQALLNQDAQVISWLEEHRAQFVVEAETLIDSCQFPSRSSAAGGCEALLSCLAPVALALEERALADQMWEVLRKASFDKNAGVASSLRLVGLSLLANKVWFGIVDWSREDTPWV